MCKSKWKKTEVNCRVNNEQSFIVRFRFNFLISPSRVSLADNKISPALRRVE